MKITSFEKLIENTDFSLLSEQKIALLTLCSQGKELGKMFEDNELIGKLEGIINFIDSIQDLAVDGYGFDKKQIFPNLQE